MNARFSIVWQLYRDRSPTGRALAKPVSFPFLVEGSSQADLAAGEPVRLDARGLMLGILVAFNEPSPFMDVAEPDQLRAAAVDLVSALSAPDLEVAVLDAAAFLREHHSLHASQTALVTAAQLCPQSALIRSDLIATCWAMLTTVPDQHRKALLRRIAATFRDSDVKLIDPGAVQQMVFAALVAFVILPDYSASKEALLGSATVRAITDEWYVDRVRRLLAAPVPSLESVL